MFIAAVLIPFALALLGFCTMVWVIIIHRIAAIVMLLIVLVLCAPLYLFDLYPLLGFQ